MWTVVYVAQKTQELFRIKDMLEENEIISRVRETKTSDDESGLCLEILVPAAELAIAQNLIIASEI